MHVETRARLCYASGKASGHGQARYAGRISSVGHIGRQRRPRATAAMGNRCAMSRCAICDCASLAPNMCARCQRSYDRTAHRDGTIWEAMAWAAKRARREERHREACRRQDREA